MDCVFCAIAEGTAPAEIIYGDDHTLAFLDINPATTGHTLVVPRAHHADWWDTPEELAALLARTAHRVAAALRGTLDPEGLNLFQATRGVAFQSVFHVHIHVIPRYRGDAVSPAWRVTPGDPAVIAATAQRIRSAAS